MANKTIYPYGVGGQTPSGIDIVNDLVTGGADKALSAQQGKELNEKLKALWSSLVEYSFINGKPDIYQTYSVTMPSDVNITAVLKDANGDVLAQPVIEGTDINIVLTPTSGYSVEIGSVKMGGQTLQVETDYTVSESGDIKTISILHISGNIVITASAQALFTVDLSGLSGVVSSNINNVVSGGSYHTKLGTSNNLYVVDDSSVQVTMGGTDITSQVYADDEINIPNVTGDIVIAASAITYISNGLVMHLDGKNRGGVAGKWTSLVNYNNGNGFNAPIEFNLTDCTEYDDHVYFNGTSSKGTLPSGFGISTLELLAYSSTLEFYYDESELVDNMMCIMYNGSGSLIEFSVFRTTSGTTANESGYVWATCCTGGAPADGTAQAIAQANASTQMYPSYLAAGGHFSCSCGIIIYNGYINSGYNKAVQSANASTNPKLALMYKDRTTSNACTKGNLYFVRVYNRGLTTQERAYNRAIDQKRFGVTFTYPPSVD